MGEVLSRPVSPDENSRWLASILPIKGEFNAFMAGLSAAALFQDSKFGLAWEREVMGRVQGMEDRHGVVPAVSSALGEFCSGDVLPLYFAILYWALDKYKCVYGIWLVPISEVLNGLLKWHYRVPRPGWVDPNIKLREWSDEFSFPSSHAQIVWTLANFFTFTSISKLRTKLFGRRLATTALVYWYMLVGPYLFAALVSLSRVYDGLHYPRDITAGAGIGVALSAAYIELLPHAKTFLLSLSPALRALCLLSVSLVCLVATHLGHAAASKHKVDEAWLEGAAKGKFKDRRISPYDKPYASYMGMCGVLAGLAVGEAFMHHFPLPAPRTIAHALLRIVVGAVGFLLSFLRIRKVEKSRESAAAQRLIRFLRYAYVPVYILWVAPFAFTRLGL